MQKLTGEQAFSLDERLQSSCFLLTEWPLSRVLLKDESQYPWLILVPRRQDIQEIWQLNHEDRVLLMEEVTWLSRVIHSHFKPDKINIGALGNLVPQLHVHLVARYQHDPLWPQGVWQSAMVTKNYEKSELSLLLDLKTAISQVKMSTDLMENIESAHT